MSDYEILGINKNADLNTIKESYKKLIKKYHPDKNPDIDASEKFIKINTAYNNLLNKQNSNFYNIINDLYEHGLFEKYINLLYNSYVLNNKKHNKVIIVNCSLEEIYNGCLKTIKYKRKISTSYLNFVYEEKIIELNINHDNYHNQKIIYKNYGDGLEYKEEYSDVIIFIKEEPHKLFKRKNNDLIAYINLNLKESLTCNTTIKILLLNNEYIDYKIDKIIYPGYKAIIKNYGFLHNNSYGNLILKFNICFPNELNENQISIINDIL